MNVVGGGEMGNFFVHLYINIHACAIRFLAMFLAQYQRLLPCLPSIPNVTFTPVNLPVCVLYLPSEFTKCAYYIQPSDFPLVLQLGKYFLYKVCQTLTDMSL